MTDQAPGGPSDDGLRAALVLLSEAIRDLRTLVAQLHSETGGMTGRSGADEAELNRTLARIDRNVALVAEWAHDESR